MHDAQAHRCRLPILLELSSARSLTVLSGINDAMAWTVSVQVTGAALFGARGTGAFVSRKARLTYGVRGSRRFDHNDPEHVCREEVRVCPLMVVCYITLHHGKNCSDWCRYVDVR